MYSNIIGKTAEHFACRPTSACGLAHPPPLFTGQVRLSLLFQVKCEWSEYRMSYQGDIDCMVLVNQS